MKNKKILMILVGFLASIILVSCGLRISDTVQDVTSEIRQETPKEDTEDLGIKQVLEQKKGENVDISTKDFTGYIYIMSTKENKNLISIMILFTMLKKGLSMISIFVIIVRHFFR